MIRKLAASSLIAFGLVSVTALAQQDPDILPPPAPAPAPAPQQAPTQQAQPQQAQPQQAQPQQAPAPAPQATAISPSDRRFIEDAARANVEEIKLGEIARSHAQNDDVRKFAQKMIDDHTKANDELKTLADQKGIALPNAPAATEQSLEVRLSKLNGPAFDKEYLSQMANDHKKDVAEFQRQAQTAKDPDVKAFAQKVLPVLQDHEKLVNELRKTEQAPPAAPQGTMPSTPSGAQHPTTTPQPRTTPAPAPAPAPRPPSGH